MAAYSRWARPYAREEQSEAARRTWWLHIERQVDPEGSMPPEQRELLIQAKARAYMARLRMQRRLGSMETATEPTDENVEPRDGAA